MLKNISTKILLNFTVFFFFAVNIYAFQEEKPAAEADSVIAEPEPSPVRFTLSPNIGISYLQSSKADDERENFQWLGKLDTKFDYDGKTFQFMASLFTQYAEVVTNGELPQKYQDAFILTLMPSVTLIRTPLIGLFLGSIFETNLGEGYVGERKTEFLDPLFMYQTLFIGQKQWQLNSKDGNNTWELTYGVGYATQQTLTKNFRKDTLTTGTESTFETGFSAILNMNMKIAISDKFNFKLDTKAVALSKDKFFDDVSNARCRLILITGLYYGIIGVEYNLNILYDKNISPMRQLEQSPMLTLAVDL